MSKVLIAAYEIQHAEYYAREVLRVGRSSWKFVSEDWDIRGCRGIELIIVEAPRYIASLLQLEKRCYISEAAEAWGLVVKRVELP